MLMKKAEALIVLLIVLIVAAPASGCQSALQTSSPAEVSTAPAASAAESHPAKPPASPQPTAAVTAAASASPAVPPETAAPAPTAREVFHLTEITYSSGAISIRYPQISGYSDQTVQGKLNKIIKDSALRDLPLLKGRQVEEFKITDTVSLNSPDVISVYFDGYSNMKDSAHPSQFFHSVTIDVKKLQTVTLPQLVSINPDFVDLLGKGTFRSAGFDMTDEALSMIKDDIGSMGSDFWVQELRSADTQDSDVSSFLTKDALGISVGVSHVLGDHVEILIKFSDLQGYRTDNPLWKVIEALSSGDVSGPVHESTAEDIMNTLGLGFHIPDEAKNIVYSIVDCADGGRIAQAVFTLDGIGYTYRKQSAAEFKDISGVNCDWTSSSAIAVSYCKGEARFIEGKQGVCLWYDVVPGVMYSLYTETGASEDSLLGLVNKLFVPVDE